MWRLEPDFLGMFFPEFDRSGDREVSGLLPGLDLRWDRMPPDLLVGPVPLLYFMVFSSGCAHKKKPGSR